MAMPIKYEALYEKGILDDGFNPGLRT